MDGVGRPEEAHHCLAGQHNATLLGPCCRLLVGVAACVRQSLNCWSSWHPQEQLCIPGACTAHHTAGLQVWTAQHHVLLQQASRHPGCCGRFACMQTAIPTHSITSGDRGHCSGMLTGGFAQRVHERDDGRPVLLRRHLVRIHVVRLHTNLQISVTAAVDEDSQDIPRKLL